MPNGEALQAALHDYPHGPYAQGSICSTAFVYINTEGPSTCNCWTQETYPAVYLLSPTQLLVLEEIIMKE